jgi:hypothetical protein
MAENEIKTLQFQQGVDLDTPPQEFSSSGKASLSNNQSAIILNNFTFDIATIRRVAIRYSAHRKTDTPFEEVQSGVINLVAKPGQALDANKWVLRHSNREDDGVSIGLTFSISVSSGVVALNYATTNLAGANHELTFYYDIQVTLA